MQNWKKIFVGYFSLLVLGFLDNVRGPYYPDIVFELNLSDTLGSLFFILASVMTIFSGQLTPEYIRRFGLLNAMRAGHSFLLLGCAGIALAPSFSWLAAACVIFGFGFGFINVGQNLLIIEGSKPHRRRQLLSGLHAVYALASLIAPVCVSLLKVSDLNWRHGFLIFMFMPLAGFIATFVVSQKQENLLPQVERKKASFTQGLSEWKAFFPYATWISLYISAELGLTSRLVLLLRREYEISDVVAPQYLSALFALMLFGRLVFTFFPFSKWPSHRVISVCLLFTFSFLCLGLLHSPYWFILCGLSMAPVFGLSLDYLTDLFPNQAEVAIASTLAISGVYIITMHFIVGVLTESYGIGNALLVLPTLVIISFVMLQFLPGKSVQNKS